MEGRCVPNCGACCDPVTIPYTQDDARRLYADGRLSFDQMFWVTNVLVPMPVREVREVAPWLVDGRYRNTISVNPDDYQTFYYRCTWFVGKPRHARITMTGPRYAASTPGWRANPRGQKHFRLRAGSMPPSEGRSSRSRSRSDASDE